MNGNNGKTKSLPTKLQNCMSSSKIKLHSVYETFLRIDITAIGIRFNHRTNLPKTIAFSPRVRWIKWARSFNKLFKRPKLEKTELSWGSVMLFYIVRSCVENTLGNQKGKNCPEEWKKGLDTHTHTNSKIKQKNLQHKRITKLRPTFHILLDKFSEWAEWDRWNPKRIVIHPLAYQLS